MPNIITNKQDNTDTLPAAQWNDMGKGLNDIANSTNQTPTTGEDAQYSKAMAQYSSDGDYYVDSGSSTNAYVAITHTARAGLLALVAGVQIRFIPSVANTAADPTIDVNGLGAVVIKDVNGDAVSAGDLASGKLITLFYDGTNFRTQTSTTSGLPIDYIKDTLTYQTATTIDWQGSARSDDNTTDLVAGSAITGTLSGASINTTYHMFVGLDAGSALVAEFDTNVDGSGLINITGAKRRVLSIITDGAGNIIPFTAVVKASGALDLAYNSVLGDDYSGGNFSGDITLTVPLNIIVKAKYDVYSNSASSVNFLNVGKAGNINTKRIVGGSNGTGSSNTQVYGEEYTNTSGQIYIVFGGSSTGNSFKTNGYIDERR